jgi:hypothetical protein
VVVGMAAKATAKGTDNYILVNKTCAFCYNQATEIISMDDLNLLSIKKDIPKHERKLMSLPICNLHLSKYVTNPHIEKSQIARVDREGEK